MSIHPALQDIFNSLKTKCSDGTSGAELCYNSDSDKGFINYFETDGTSANIFVESIDSTVRVRYFDGSGNAMFESEYPIGSTDADSMADDIVDGAHRFSGNQEPHAINEADDVEHLRAVLEMGYGPTKPIVLEMEQEQPANPTGNQEEVKPVAKKRAQKRTQSAGKPEPTAEPKAEQKAESPNKENPVIDEPGIFEKTYPKMAERIKSRLNDDTAAKRLIDYLNVKKNLQNVEANSGIDFKSEKPFVLDQAVTKLANIYNDTASEEKQITVPVRAANIETPNDKKPDPLASVPHVTIPKNFNRSPVSLDDACATMRFGYPVINFGSDTIKDILRDNDDDYIKPLIKEFVKEIKGTPLEKPLVGTFGGGLFWSKTRNRIRELGAAKCFPCIHKPLKISGPENVETLFNGGDDETTDVVVHPINTKSSAIKESVDSMSEPALTEAKNVNNGFIDGNPIEVPIAYLVQFYTIAKPQSPEGMAKYTRYMSQDDLKSIMSLVKPESVEAAKKSVRPFREAIINAYLQEHNGILPYYILVSRRSEPREKTRISQKPLLHDMYLVKSVDPVTKNRIGYFVDQATRKNLFELG